MADIVQRKPEASSLQALKHVLDRVPPEAITKAVDIIADVVRANKVIEAVSHVSVGSAVESVGEPVCARL